MTIRSHYGYWWVRDESLIIWFVQTEPIPLLKRLRMRLILFLLKIAKLATYTRDGQWWVIVCHDRHVRRWILRRLLE